MRSGHFVYVISESKSGQPCSPVKIGISKDVNARLRTLQTAHSRRLILVTYFTFPDQRFAAEVERAFHIVMAGKKTVGEWFDLIPIKAVESMCSNVRFALRHYLSGDQVLLRAMEDWTGLNENLANLEVWQNRIGPSNDNVMVSKHE